MKAVIVTGGKQYTVSEGDVLYIEKLNVEAEQTVKFDQVLAVLDGDNSKVGTPVVEGASVEAKVVKNGKGKKIVIFKYKAKKGEKSKAGSDIVCAAVSTAVTMAEAIVNDICGAKAKVRVKEQDARITLTLPASCDEEDAVQAALAGLLLTLCNLRDQYPDYIQVLEV